MPHVTVAADAGRRIYTAGVSQTVFSVPFPFYAAGDLQVYVNGALQSVSAYTVTGTAVDGGFQSGTVTFIAAPATGATVTISRATAIARTTDFPYPAQTLDIRSLNTEFDRLTMVQQEAADQRGRLLRISEAEPSIIELPLVSERSLNVLGFGPSGEPRAVTPAEIQAGFGYSPATVFAAPIGTGAGVVPAAIAERFRNRANAKTDFGIQLYEDDGFTLRDNTSRIQAAIDAIQPYSGALFFERVSGNQYLMTGPTTMRDTGVYKAANFSMIGEQDYDGTRQTRDSIPGLPTQYQGGVALKLIAGSTGPLITSPPDAGMLNIRRMGFDGNNTQQAAPRRVIEWQDAPSGPRYAGNLNEVWVSNSTAEGIFVGTNRSQGRFIDVWVQYCGASGGAPAWNIRTYDTQVERPGIGMCPGTGMYLGGSAQFEMRGGAIWNCKTALTIGSDTLSAYFSGVHFDASSEAQVTIAAYTADSRPSVRHFINCMFSRRDVGASGTVPYVDGTFDDIVSGDPSLSLTGCQFAGRASGTGNRRSRYNLFFSDGAARALVVGENARPNIAHVTAFTNDWNRVRRGPSTDDNNYYIPGNIINLTQTTFGGISVLASDNTPVASLTAGFVGGKEGALQLWTAAGAKDLILCAGTGVGRSKIGTLIAPEFANDAGAAAGGLAIGDLYFSTTNSSYTKRRV